MTTDYTRELVDEAPVGSGPLPDQLPDFAVRIGLVVLRGLKRLTDAITPTELALFERTVGAARTAMLGSVVRLGIPDALAERPMTSSELAREVGVNQDALHRLMRVLVYDGFFSLRSDGAWENSRLSSALRTGTLSRSRQWLLYFSSASNLAAWNAFDHVLRTCASGFEHVHGKGVWDYLALHPDQERCFAEAMMGFTVRAAPFVATTYPWSEVKTVCDVGGGRGTLLSEVLLRNPELRGVLCEARGLEPLAMKLFDARGLSDRVSFTTGNFFDEVPKGADLYTLKSIMHDWSDEACCKILSVVRAAMEPGKRVLLVEALLDRDDVTTPITMADIQMMVVCGNGRERSIGEYHALLRRSGFVPGRVWPTTIDSLIEGIAV